jgi:orotate phosphoribosyltransferase
MTDNRTRISELLVQTKAFRSLEKPVILTSGELGIYYINTEKLVQDNGEFEKYGDNSKDMIKHAIGMLDKQKTFKEVINMMTEKISPYINEASTGNSYYSCFISGGQRRDWLFSGPIANRMALKHVSLYKDGKIEILDNYLNVCHSSVRSMAGIHAVDLLTEGSSVYREEQGKEKGWLPMLRAEGAIVNNLFAVVSRKQGAEQILKNQKVNVYSFVDIDNNFIRDYSKMPERDLKYIENPKAWSEDYLEKNGALEFLEDFNPEGKKFDRAKKFLKRYEKVLKETSGCYELDKAVQKKYGKCLEEITQ